MKAHHHKKKRWVSKTTVSLLFCGGVLVFRLSFFNETVCYHSKIETYVENGFLLVPFQQQNFLGFFHVLKSCDFSQKSISPLSYFETFSKTSCFVSNFLYKTRFLIFASEMGFSFFWISFNS